ncbi:MAG: peptide chain release factor N(5)-glutamine methyltransferase [Candidatus Binatia bacterium]
MSGENFQSVGDIGPRPNTVLQALREGTGSLGRLGIESARLDAEVLLGFVLGGGREQIYLNYEMPLKSHDKEWYLRLLQRRARGEPIAYITGHREFWSLDFFVTPDVLVPRAETELLVEATLGQIEETASRDSSKILERNFQVLDLGTGSGAIGVSLTKERRDVEVWATDLSPKALEIARANADRHGVKDRIRFVEGDLFEPVERQCGFFHGVVSNPPYVRRSEMEFLSPEVREWEPKVALDGGPDGLDFHRRIIQQGHLYLKDGGFMVLEIAPDMGEEVCRLLESAGRYSEGSIHRDLAGRNRIVSTRKLPQSKTVD